MRIAYRVSWVTLLVGACGGESHSPWPVNECAARLSVVQLPKLAAAMTAANGMDGFKAVDALFADQKLIFATGAPPPCVVDGQIPTELGVSFSADCTSTSCAFGWHFSMYPFVREFRAMANRGGDAVTVAIEHDTYHSRQSGGTSVRSDGSLKLTENTVDGEFRLHEEIPGLDLPPRWTSETVLDYRSIRLDAQGCPIGGSLHAVRISESLDGFEGSSEDIEGTVSFGPACGELSLTPAMAP